MAAQFYPSLPFVVANLFAPVTANSFAEQPVHIAAKDFVGYSCKAFAMFGCKTFAMFSCKAFAMLDCKTFAMFSCKTFAMFSCKTFAMFSCKAFAMFSCKTFAMFSCKAFAMFSCKAFAMFSCKTFAMFSCNEPSANKFAVTGANKFAVTGANKFANTVMATATVSTTLINNLKIHKIMKIKILIAVICLMSASMKAQVITQILKVNGECSMCKKTIETACYGVKGLKTAEWNADSLALTVSFDSTKTNAAAILKRVALVGYDSEQFKASDKVYSKLHGCCQYDRSKVTVVAAKKE